MEVAGYEKTADQCNSKICKLKLKYRETNDAKKNKEKIGDNLRNWKLI